MLLGQAHRRFHHDTAQQVAGTSAAHRLDALPAQAEYMAALGFRRHADGGAAIERGHFDLRAERGLSQAHRHLAVQVVAIALENLVLAHAHFNIEIARSRAGWPGLALAGKADAIAGIYAGGNAHRQRAFVLQPALAVAGLAGILDHPTGAAAMRTGLLDRKNAVLHSHAAHAAASRASDGLAIGGTRAVAMMAIDQRGNLDLLLDAGDRFFQIEVQHVAKVCTPRAACTAAEDVGKDVPEDVTDIAESGAGAAPAAHAVLEGGMAQAVVLR